ncbi:NUDIX hydrolase [Streptomyces badius]
MATPDFIRDIRATAGHQLLLLPGVTAVVLDDEGRVLLGQARGHGEVGDRRRDLRAGRGAGDGGARSAGGDRRALCAGAVGAGPGAGARAVRQRRPLPVLDITFGCRATGGEARVNDDESLEVGWFPLDGLPPLGEFALFRIKQALTEGPAWFQPTPSTT